ncbi:P1 family peptidase [Jannaschia aquimarina]|uniref:Peptidase family S58 n=1 Tax=Jannaschia aquimarina TaxID=935700 RepID=A0A0D1EJE2_9RHOB|nr:P1 family peptidase [Jannaschia aquimarina]KIT17719.1 Peptidase family S58 [Jannaschia aquimarina]SNS78220.1 D-aminopeptidase [Jannaschia aquimarina]
MKAGPRNLITDIAGLRVGNAEDTAVRSGVTVLTGDAPFVAGVHVMGGAPGTRETDLLAPDKLVQEVDALVLSGGSAFGLGAADGVMAGLRAAGRGFAVGEMRVPIVPGAILFDLLNGGDKDWDTAPYPALGRAALGAADTDFDLGSAGAGYGAGTMDLRGGLGSASCVLDDGTCVGALVAVNALGGACDDLGRFHAAPWELDDEFGGLGPPMPDPAWEPYGKRPQGAATTIAIVATDAKLTQSQATRMAVAAHDGLARALVPSHTPLDGDLVFAAATGTGRDVKDPWDALRLGHAAACCLARAVARGVYAAGPGGHLPAWSEQFGS